MKSPLLGLLAAATYADVIPSSDVITVSTRGGFAMSFFLKVFNLRFIMIQTVSAPTRPPSERPVEKVTMGGA